ncbi:MAG TPA: universal stress protein [Solirubrobacteraceae bacterium]|nr:universal stress protein [Solirubrobacteraceae bacterium]
MFRNVLIGVDGRQGGRDAIALARQLASSDGGLTLAHVCTPFLGRGAVESLRWQRAEAQKLLEGERDRAAVDADLAVRDPSPVGPGLHELAEQRRADLLVVGSTRHAILGRVLMGDDCRAALDGAPCAVAIAPRGYAQAPHRLKRVGVGYDASPESEHALTAARKLARRHAGEINVLWVVSLQNVREEKPIAANWPSAVDELIERHAERLARLHDVHGVVTYGGAREELVQFGKHLDLLIVGSRGYGPVGRLVHGSVSGHLVGHSTCPLLVVPRGTPAVAPPPDTERQEHTAAVRDSTISPQGAVR